MKKELLQRNYCPEKWDDMETTCSGRHCSICDTDLPDLSELPLNELVSNHLDSGKCVRMTDSQLHFLTFYKNLRNSVAFSTVALSMSFFNYSYSQSIENSTFTKDSCLVTGKAVFADDKTASKFVSIYVTADGKTFETKTDREGNFAINLPKNCTISFSNLKKLESKRIRNRNRMRLGKNEIRRDKRRMGWL